MAHLRILRRHILVPAAVLLLAGTAAASAQSRCEGTLCDLYYDHMATPQQPNPQQPARTAAPAQAQPAQAGDGVLSRLFNGGVPPQPQADAGTAPTKKPLVAVQGGGVIGLMQGRTPQRCTGTFCDLYYGGPPPEQPAAAEPVAAAPGAAAPAAPSADAEIDEPVAASRGIEPRESVRRCAAKAGDPWACYR